MPYGRLTSQRRPVQATTGVCLNARCIWTTSGSYSEHGLLRQSTSVDVTETPPWAARLPESPTLLRLACSAVTAAPLFGELSFACWELMLLAAAAAAAGCCVTDGSCSRCSGGAAAAAPLCAGSDLGTATAVCCRCARDTLLKLSLSRRPFGCRRGGSLARAARLSCTRMAEAEP